MLPVGKPASAFASSMRPKHHFDFGGLLPLIDDVKNLTLF
jgi:hypothetical protein